MSKKRIYYQVCPYCGYKRHNFDHPIVDGIVLWDKYKCSRCKGEWNA